MKTKFQTGNVGTSRAISHLLYPHAHAGPAPVTAAAARLERERKTRRSGSFYTSGSLDLKEVEL